MLTSISCRELFRSGLPRNFVFIATYKTFSRRNAWKIFDIKDPSGDTQLALLFDKKKASIVYRDIYRQTRTVPFSKNVGDLVSDFDINPYLTTGFSIVINSTFINRGFRCDLKSYLIFR